MSGQSAVDRSMMTGESVPVDAAAGDSVTGGTIVLTGRLVVRAVKVGRDTQLAHLVALVEQAQAGKAGIQRLADRICAVFVPCVLACAAATLAGWLLAGSPAGHAVSAALAVLIIACPCALGLATPAALVVASGRGAQLGVFIKGYQALESSRAIDTVVLDKTGTVTTGQMTVTGVMPPRWPPWPRPRRGRWRRPRASRPCPAWALVGWWTVMRSSSGGKGCSLTGGPASRPTCPPGAVPRSGPAFRPTWPPGAVPRSGPAARPCSSAGTT